MTTNTLAGPEDVVFWNLVNAQELHCEWTKTWGPDIGFTSPAAGGAIALSQANHRATRTWGSRGAMTRAADTGRPLQDVLNDDYDDLRGLGACFDVEHSIDALQSYYETGMPWLG